MPLLAGDIGKILELAMVKATPSQCNPTCSASPFSRGPKIQNSSKEKLVQDRMKSKRTVARRRRWSLKSAFRYSSLSRSQKTSRIRILVLQRSKRLRTILMYKSTNLRIVPLTRGQTISPTKSTDLKKYSTHLKISYQYQCQVPRRVPKVKMLSVAISRCLRPKIQSPISSISKTPSNSPIHRRTNYNPSWR